MHEWLVFFGIHGLAAHLRHYLFAATGHVVVQLTQFQVGAKRATDERARGSQRKIAILGLPRSDNFGKLAQFLRHEVASTGEQHERLVANRALQVGQQVVGSAHRGLPWVVARVVVVARMVVRMPGGGADEEACGVVSVVAYTCTGRTTASVESAAAVASSASRRRFSLRKESYTSSSTCFCRSVMVGSAMTASTTAPPTTRSSRMPACT